MSKPLIALATLAVVAVVVFALVRTGDDPASPSAEVNLPTAGASVDGTPASTVTPASAIEVRTAPTPDESGAAQLTGTGPVPVDELRIVTLLLYDAIPAIFDPEFVTAEEASAQLADDDLVIGVEIDGEARAYGTAFLSRHEIVNDTVGGRPIMVTW